MKQSEVNKIVAQHYQSFLLGKKYDVVQDSWRGFLLHVNQIVKEMSEDGTQQHTLCIESILDDLKLGWEE